MRDYRPIPRGSVKNSIYFVMRDPNTAGSQPIIGLAYNTAGIALSYVKKRGDRVAITPADLASPTAAWTSGGIKAVDGTNQPGLYRLDVPDAAFTDDGISDEVIVTVKATGFHTLHIRIPLTDKPDVYVSPGTTRTNS